MDVRKNIYLKQGQAFSVKIGSLSQDGAQNTQ